MCEPTTIALVASTVISTGASIYSQNQQAKAQTEALNKQNQLQADEISRQAGQEISERAREARRERATARVLAGESGVNLGSGSFLAQLQSSAMQQYNDHGLIVQNEKSQQMAREANARSQAANITHIGGLEAALTIGAAGAGAWGSAEAARKKGAGSK